MTGIQPNVNTLGFGKVSGPPIAFAIVEIFTWVLQQFWNVPVPANIQMDIALVLSMLFVYLIPAGPRGAFNVGDFSHWS
jgi:hypothetical protein